MVFHWDIIATSRYINQVSKLSIQEQELIQRQWIEVANAPNPLTVGQASTCGQPVNPSVVVIFPGLAFEFIYEIIQADNTIRLINCERLTFLNHGQVD